MRRGLSFTVRFANRSDLPVPVSVYGQIENVCDGNASDAAVAAWMLLYRLRLSARVPHLPSFAATSLMRQPLRSPPSRVRTDRVGIGTPGSA